MPLPLIAAGANILGGILGSVFGAGDREKAQKQLQEAYNQALDTVGDPDLARQLVLQQYQSAGQLTPELEKAINAGPSQVSQIQEDPALRQAQSKALQSLIQQSTTGLSATDRAALNKVRADTARDTEAKRQQILQNFAARGQGGTANELVAALQAAQAGNQSESEAADRQAAMAQQNALQALMQSGQLGGQIRGQDFDVNRAKASAADEIAKFNVQNAVGRQQRNVGSQNEAQQFNLQNAQGISNQNVSQANQEAQNARNIRLQQAQAKANLMLGKGQSSADYLNNKAGRTEQAFKGVGSGISQAATGGAFDNLFGGGGESAPAAPENNTGKLSGYNYNKTSKDFFGLGG